MRRLVVSIILAFSLMGPSVISLATNLQNQNSGKPSSNKNSRKSSNKNAGKSSNRNSGESSNKNSTRPRGNRNTGITTVKGAGNPNAKVWVNLASGVYHCEGSKWFGKTKSGQYMTQREALDKNYHADHGKACQ
jgi:hypothetical protein